MGRVAEVTGLLAEVLTARAATGPHLVVVDGSGAAAFVDALVAALGAPHVRLTGDQAGPAAAVVAVVDGPQRRSAGDTVIFLRTARGGDGERGADVVVDHHDPAWPVIRHLDPALAAPERWYLSESRAFFGIRAATWDVSFGEDLPAYARAVTAAGIRPGDVVLDVGTGTGRALPALTAAAGPDGLVLGLDLTPAMLSEARRAGRDDPAVLVLADARRLPVGTARVDAVFAAGLVQHLPDPGAGLAELARVVRPGGQLTIFHPSGRAALAARHGRRLRADEPLAEEVLPRLLAAHGWQPTGYEDAPDRFFATARRAR